MSGGGRGAFLSKAPAALSVEAAGVSLLLWGLKLRRSQLLSGANSAAGTASGLRDVTGCSRLWDSSRSAPLALPDRPVVLAGFVGIEAEGGFHGLHKLGEGNVVLLKERP